MKLTLDLIVFDLDGTLVDSIGDLADSLNYAANQMKLPDVPNTDMPKYVGNGVRVLISKGLKLAEGNPDLDKAEAIFMDYYKDNLTNRTTFYPNVKHILHYFKGKKMAVLSNKPDDFTKKVITELNLINTFDIVMGSSSQFQRKPAPDPLLYIMKTLGVKPNKTLMVGDGDTDIDTGKAAGAHTCGLTYGYRTRKELATLSPDILLDNIGELSKFVI